LMEVESGTGAAAFDDAHLVLAIGHGEEGVAHDGFVVGVAAGFGGGAVAKGALPAAEAGAGAEVGGGEGLGAALGEVEVVSEGGGFAWGEDAVPGEGGGFGGGGTSATSSSAKPIPTTSRTGASAPPAESAQATR
jgi:hypothetical protein